MRNFRRIITIFHLLKPMKTTWANADLTEGLHGV